MLLKQRSNGHLVEVENVHHLFNVFHEEIVGRDQVGEEVGKRSWLAGEIGLKTLAS
jgi:hypothetical protein